MSTKEKFLSKLKNVIDDFNIYLLYENSTGVPDGTINNLPNVKITGFKVEIPDEDGTYIFISAKEFAEYILGKKV